MPPSAVWFDYNLYSRASLPFEFDAYLGAEVTEVRSFTDLAAWSAATGWDRNSRVAPLIYSKFQDRNGRWRAREDCVGDSNFTPDLNVGPESVNIPALQRRRDLHPRHAAELEARGRAGPAGLSLRHGAGRGAGRPRLVVCGPHRLPPHRRQPGRAGHVPRLPAAGENARRLVLPGRADGQGLRPHAGRRRGPLPDRHASQAAAAAGDRPLCGPRGGRPGGEIPRQADHRRAWPRRWPRTAIRETDTVANSFSALFGTPTLERACPIQGL